MARVLLLIGLIGGAAASCAAGAECDSRVGKKCASATMLDDCVIHSCKNKQCAPCQVDADCDSSSLVCENPNKFWLTKSGAGLFGGAIAANTGGSCVHKPLFPLDKWDWVTLFLVILACILAASGGIGGGGLLVPLYILVSGFAANAASPLSSATITGGGIANYYSYSRRLHPDFEKGVYKPLIDYDTALLIMPALLLGTLYGTILNKILPEWLFLALMFVLMIKYSVRTTRKGMRIYKKETEDREEAAAAAAGGGEGGGGGEGEGAAAKSAALTVAAPASASDVGASDDEPVRHGQVSSVLEAGAAQEDRPRAASVNAAKAKVVYFPRKQLLITVGAWILTFVIALFKGKAGTKSAVGVECNTGGYWAVIMAGTVLLTGLTWYVRKTVLADIAANGQLDKPGVIKWDAENTIKYPMVCVLCGVMAGLMGIGGGMVVGPLLIELGVVSQVVAATSAYTVVITASSATVQFMVMGSLQYDYAAAVAIVGLVTTFLGQYVVDGMIKKYNRASVIIFAIAAIMVISTFLLGYTGIAKVIRQVDNDSSLGMRPLCT